MRLAIPKIHRDQTPKGQVLVLFVLMLVVLILFVGLAIDMGFAYITKASLSKAVDAASLTGIRNLGQGQSVATTLAANSFAANYGRPGRDVSKVTPSITFTTGADNSTLINVDATTTINTFFIRVLPAFKTLTVHANAQATRVRLIMALVLDRSGSMGTPPPDGSGGGAALPGAVSTFINLFDDNIDYAAMSSFACSATLDVAMEQPFKSDITEAANAMIFDGRTYSDGGLQIGLAQIQAAGSSSDDNVFRVLVFFTDGFANTFQGPFGPKGAPLNLGQDDPFGSEQNGPWGFSFMGPDLPTCSNPSSTSNQFLSIDGSVKTISTGNQNVWNEGQLRALNTATQIHNANIVVYSIGLGGQLNENFLKQIANDPTGPGYDSTKPAGEAFFAPSAAQLQSVFQQIATKILFRITQ